MNIALINPTYDNSFVSTDTMISRYFHPRELTKALSARVKNATWVQAYREAGELNIGTLHCQLFEARAFSGGQKDLMSQHVVSSSLSRIIDNIRPDFVHITGLLPMDILQIAEICSAYTTRLSASFHGGQPSNDPSFFSLQQSALKKLSLILFNSPERMKIWQDANLIDSSTRIGICPETSSYFSSKNRVQARLITDMPGDPVCLATARLHPVKDPLTMLKGFEQILDVKSGARLYWFFQTAELLDELEALLNSSPQLREAVQLRGAVEQYEKMEDIFNSADFFIQASLNEYGGNSLVEAMACGVIPVVSNIPSFRYLTGDDLFATLFDIGDSQGLARIINDIPRDNYAEYSNRIRKFYDTFLSFDKIARTILAVE